MKIASVAEVKSQLSAFLRVAEGGPVVVTRNGRPVGVLLGVQDEEEIERLLLAYSPRLRAILDRSRQQIRAGAGIGHEDFWAGVEARKTPRGRGKGRRRQV